MLSHKWHEEGTEGLYVSQTDGWDTVADWNDPLKGGKTGIVEADLGSKETPWRTVSAMVIYYETSALHYSTTVIHALEIKENVPVYSKRLSFVSNSGSPKIYNTSIYRFQDLKVSAEIQGFDLISDVSYSFGGHGCLLVNLNISGAGNISFGSNVRMQSVFVQNANIIGWTQLLSANPGSFTAKGCSFNILKAYNSEFESCVLIDCQVAELDSLLGGKYYLYNTTVTTNNASENELVYLSEAPNLDANGYLPVDSELAKGVLGYLGARPTAMSYSGSELVANAALKNLKFENNELVVEQLNVAAQAATANTITLNEIATGDLANLTIEILSGTGAGQIRQLSDFNETSKIATVTEAWSTVPDVTSQYALSARYEKLFDFKVLATLDKLFVDSPNVHYLEISVGADLANLTTYKVRNGAIASKHEGVGNGDLDYTHLNNLVKMQAVRFCKVAFEIMTPNISQ